MSSEVCILEDGRRVRFSLKRRKRDPYYLVSFPGPASKRVERTTKEENKRRATDSAVVIIKNEYDPGPVINTVSWDDAIRLMTDAMTAKNLRPGTISDYKTNVGNLRKQFPKTEGPFAVTPLMAEEYKAVRITAGKSVQTVKNDLIALSVVYGKWWKKVCKIVDLNPFAEVEPPKTDKRPPRILTPAEQTAFLNWLSVRWNGWRLPLLFLEIKGLVGCRITELASALSDGLKNSRIQFEAETTKGRKQRSVKVPSAIFDELQAIKGPTYVFEAFSQQLRGVHIKRGKPNHARCVQGYLPRKLKNWIELEAGVYFKRNPEATKFKLHNFRGTAMSKARTAGVSYDDASIAFGCHPETMRRHYISLDEVSISDRVMDRIQGRGAEKSGEKSGEIDPTPPKKPSNDDAA